MPMMEVCCFCDAKFPYVKDENPSQLAKHWEICEKRKSLSKLAQALIPVFMHVDFCDHFCCGLSEGACHARGLEDVLKQDEFEYVNTVYDELARIPGIRKAVLRQNPPKTPAMILADWLESLWKRVRG